MLVLVSGCSGGLGERQVFENGRENTSGPVHTDELFDIVVQFMNLTGATVHLVSLSLVGAQPNLRFVGTSMYNIHRLGGFPAEGLGNLHSECPRDFVPYPVNSINVAPYQHSNWFGVLTIRMLKPGRYVISQVKITYSIAGRTGWQYFSSNLTLTVRSPPQPGPRPKSSQDCI